MDSYFAPAEAPSLQSLNITALSLQNGSKRADVLVLNATFGQSDKVNVGIDDSGKALTITAQEIVDKLNELLKADLPNGLQSLKPEDVTPEATANRIVNGATGLFDIYAAQNPDLEGEELVSKFMETIRGGIEQGYSEAFDTLKGLGAFDIEGVQDSVEQTKSLIESKLVTFERLLRERLGISDNQVTTDTVASAASSEFLKQTGSSLLDVVA